MSNEDQVYSGEVHTGSTELALTGSASINDLRSRMQQMEQMIELKRDFLKKNLKEGIDRDYAVIPGTQKKSLLKPGAEKLLDWHGFYAEYELKAEKEDWELGLFAYTYRCIIKQKGTNIFQGNCEGDCTTWESKYRFEWKYEKDVPKHLDIKTLKSKNYGTDEKPRIKFFVPIDNLVDRRNTVRKMAQKRALIGATVLATGTSDLFTSDELDDDPDGNHQGNAAGDSGGEGSGNDKPRDYGDPISEPQSKRLYAIRKSHKIEDGEFKAWLKAKYGLDSDKKIGWKIYKEICEACESDNLELPKPDPTPNPSTESKPEDKPAGSQGVPASGATLSVHMIKAFSQEVAAAKKTDKEFRAWLAEFDSKYSGKGMNDILATDFDRIIEAFVKCAQAGAL